MEIVIKKPDLTQTIQYLEELNPKQQAMLADEIRKIWLINQAKKLDAKVLGFELSNDMTMDEIVAEVRAVRNAQCAMRSSKVVLDTNIWISYFLRNNNEQFLRSILDNDIKLYRCTALTKELTDVIMRPKVLRKLQLSAKEYITFYEVLTHNFPTTPVFTACWRPSRQLFIWFSNAKADANYLVSGDKKVLTTSATPNLSVITLPQFEKLLFNP